MRLRDAEDVHVELLTTSYDPRVVVDGDADLRLMPRLAHALGDAVRASRRVVVVDQTAVGFVSCRIADQLLTCHDELDATGDDSPCAAHIRSSRDR